MTRLPGSEYRILLHEDQYAAIYERMRAEDLLWAAWPDVDEWSADFFCQKMARPENMVIGGFVDGELAGVMTLTPMATQSQCAEIGLTAFRKHFSIALPLCMGALLFALETIRPASFFGRVAITHRHILRLLGGLGFSRMGILPGLMWLARKKRFVDGVVVMATPESITRAAANAAADKVF